MTFRKMVTVAVTLLLCGGGAVQAQDVSTTEASLGAPVPKVSYGPYVRLEASGSWFIPGEGSWQPPGYPKDPEVFFDVSGGHPLGGTVAVGFDMSNGFRGELAATHMFSQDISAPWSYTVPATTGPHADITTSVSSTALMANGYYSFGLGGDPRYSAFVTGGVGVASNRVGEWTRTNASAVRPVRVFEGASNASLAWNVGAGLSFDLAPRGSRPIFLDLSYRYMDFGTAEGGSTLLKGSGHSTPVQPFTFDVTSHVIGVGIRIPIERF